MVLVICFIFLFSVLAFAQGKDIQTKGNVTGLDFAKKTVIVNKKTFVWDVTTLFYDDRGSPISITADRLTKGTCVSIEATWTKNRSLVIKKLFFLPK